jgi:diacylglycerol kinase (ATP)
VPARADRGAALDDSAAPAARCAVVFNPTKVSDQFRRQVEKILGRDGWADTLWLETSAEDPGRAMTREAVSAEVALVVAAGGDGTVRIVADGLAGSGIPMGVVPAGTANLLARNLDLPLEEMAALEVAFARHTRTIDLIRLSVDDHPPEHFAVIAGIGVDAMIMDETDPALKDKMGSAAYFLAAAKALRRLPVRLTVQLDDRRPVRRRAMICAIANIGELAGNLVLVPGAAPDDGLLDVYIASPRRFWHWIKIGLRLITRRPKKDDQVDQVAGKRVTITLHAPTTTNSTATWSAPAPHSPRKSARPPSPSASRTPTRPPTRATDPGPPNPVSDPFSDGQDDTPVDLGLDDPGAFGERHGGVDAITPCRPVTWQNNRCSAPVQPVE